MAKSVDAADLKSASLTGSVGSSPAVRTTLRVSAVSSKPGRPSRRSSSTSHGPGHERTEADNLHLWRGEQHVLRGVSFAWPAGECLQVTGANGAGKTTLLRALCGLVPLEDGPGALARRDMNRGSAEPFTANSTISAMTMVSRPI